MKGQAKASSSQTERRLERVADFLETLSLGRFVLFCFLFFIFVSLKRCRKRIFKSVLQHHHAAFMLNTLPWTRFRYMFPRSKRTQSQHEYCKTNNEYICNIGQRLENMLRMSSAVQLFSNRIQSLWGP